MARTNHALSNGIWLQFYKKGSGTSTVVYAEALDEALCFGWIDGQLKRGDENFYIQRFTPRRARSMWSKRNIGLVAKLEKEGKMHPAGQKAIEAAKADGRWDSEFLSQLIFEPLSRENWSKFIQLFGEKGACGNCWCMYYRLSKPDYLEGNANDRNKESMHNLVINRTVQILRAGRF